MKEKYMMIALKEAKKSLKYNDVPVGAIILKNNKVVAKSYNKKEKYQSATRHAEIDVIEKASKKLNTWHLDDCTIYITMEPCLMCTGAIIQARIKKIVYATDNNKYGFSKQTNNLLEKNNINITKNILKEESIKLLQDFFKNKRQ
ncbi:MAG: nucleoside deaminase [Bacilli bacterium]|nr:nucleoside deaminase [Bacilli bacterium]